MSPRARTTAPKRSGSTTRRASTAKRGKGHTALDRLTKSVDAAQDALKDLRGELGRSGSGVLRDLDKQLKDARKSLRGTSKSVLKDLDELQQKLPGRSGAKSTTTRKSTSTARKSTSSRSGTARKSTSRASASRSSSARKSTSGGSARSTAKKK